MYVSSPVAAQIPHPLILSESEKNVIDFRSKHIGIIDNRLSLTSLTPEHQPMLPSLRLRSPNLNAKDR